MDSEAYELDEETLQRIFATTITPVFFGAATATEHPVVILVGAQPGAGKTAAGARAIKKIKQPVIRIIGDDFRPYHPDFEALLSGNPADMPDGTAQASGAWVRKSINYAIEHRISVLVEGTFKDADVPMDTARLFQDAGFAVHVVALAVKPAVSLASIATRYVHDMELHKDARFTSVAAHNIAAAALPVTVGRLSAPTGGLVGRLQIVTRTEELFDEYGFPSVGYPRARGIVEAAQHAPFSDDERKTWAEGVLRALSYFRNHDAELPEVQALVAALHDDLITVGLTFVPGSTGDGGHVEDSIVDDTDLNKTA